MKSHDSILNDIMDRIITKKVGIVSLGCAKNLVNSEQMMYLIKSAGFEVTGETNGADAVVVNTCAFIDSAKSEAIDTILEISAARGKSGHGKIIVAGCLAQRYKDEIMRELPEIDAVVGVGSYDRIVEAIDGALTGGRPEFFGETGGPVSETERVITTSKVWAYLKIAEGCDNRCAYCVIPDIRGRYRSRPIENIVKEAEWLAERGTKELIIVAQDVTRFGLDLYGKTRLADLLSALCRIDGIKWIRLHYLYPDEISDELIDVIAKNGKILKYLDIPVQHISDSILKKMNRRGNGEDIRTLFRRLRERIPGVVLRTSIIAGLPGEGDTEFQELCGFLREAKIERAGVFTYSPQEGTVAALMERPEAGVAERRAELLAEIQTRIMDDFNGSRVGSVTAVLIEGYENTAQANANTRPHSDQNQRMREGPDSTGKRRYYGRSFAESPDIDGYITVTGSRAKPGEFVDVRITGVEYGGLTGVVCRRPYNI